MWRGPGGEAYFTRATSQSVTVQSSLEPYSRGPMNPLRESKAVPHFHFNHIVHSPKVGKKTSEGDRGRMSQALLLAHESNFFGHDCSE